MLQIVGITLSVIRGAAGKAKWPAVAMIVLIALGGCTQRQPRKRIDYPNLRMEIIRRLHARYVSDPNDMQPYMMVLRGEKKDLRTKQ